MQIMPLSWFYIYGESHLYSNIPTREVWVGRGIIVSWYWFVLKHEPSRALSQKGEYSCQLNCQTNNFLFVAIPNHISYINFKASMMIVKCSMGLVHIVPHSQPAILSTHCRLNLRVTSELHLTSTIVGWGHLHPLPPSGVYEPQLSILWYIPKLILFFIE